MLRRCLGFLVLFFLVPESVFLYAVSLDSKMAVEETREKRKEREESRDRRETRAERR